MKDHLGEVRRPSNTPKDSIVEVQVTFAVPERVLRWAIAQASAHAKERNADHVTAILVAAHREAAVVSVKLP